MNYVCQTCNQTNSCIVNTEKEGSKKTTQAVLKIHKIKHKRGWVIVQDLLGSVPSKHAAHTSLCHVTMSVCVGIYTHFQSAFHPSADVWAEGDLPPGWREISDSSEVYFWHVPTGTTQYDRPVASDNTSSNNEPDAELDQQSDKQESLKPPAEVSRPTKVLFSFI